MALRSQRILVGPCSFSSVSAFLLASFALTLCKISEIGPSSIGLSLSWHVLFLFPSSLLACKLLSKMVGAALVELLSCTSLPVCFPVFLLPLVSLEQ